MQFHTISIPTINQFQIPLLLLRFVHPKVLKPRWPRWSQAMLSQTKLSCMVFPLLTPKPGLPVWRYQVLWQSFQQNLELRWGWGKFTTRKVYWEKAISFKKLWNEYILPRSSKTSGTMSLVASWIWCWARQDSLGCMVFHRLYPKTQQGVSSKGSKVITTEFLKQTDFDTRDKRILNDLMYLKGNPHMFVCVRVDLMCHWYYIRYSNKFWHVDTCCFSQFFAKNVWILLDDR